MEQPERVWDVVRRQGPRCICRFCPQPGLANDGTMSEPRLGYCAAAFAARRRFVFSVEYFYAECGISISLTHCLLLTYLFSIFISQ